MGKRRYFLDNYFDSLVFYSLLGKEYFQGGAITIL